MRVTAAAPLRRGESELWDVIVIGAGPAGAMVSYELARREQRVLLIERKEFPRYKVCGACVNATALQQLAASGLAQLAAELPGVSLNQIVLGSRWGRCTLPIAMGRAIAREEFDQGLVNCAIRAGAHFLCPAQAKLLPAAFGTATRTVAVQHGSGPRHLDARIVIVAAGLGAAGRVLDHELSEEVADDSRVGLGGVFYDPASRRLDETIRMAVGHHGYVGAVRLASGHWNIAAAVDRSWLREQRTPDAAVARIFAEGGFGELPPVRASAWQGTPALTRAAQEVAGWRVLLIGDAAGYVEPFTGEGITWALASARAVAPLAVRGVAAWTEAIARQWQCWQRTSLRRKQQRCRQLTSCLRQPWAVRGGVLSARRFPRLAAWISRQMTRPASECGVWS